jgi:PHD/YefM family antitoxin component YafN of YafNO toxin-antitoxin module
MNVLEISSTDFRNKQTAMFDLADRGTQVIIRRKKKPAYVLIPVAEDDAVLSPAMTQRIEEGLHNIRTGNTKRYTLSDLQAKLGL